METLRDKITQEVKNTVGYNEAVNKNSFMVGVSVAISKMEEYYSKEVSQLSYQVDLYKKMYESVDSDMKTLVNVLQKYSD